MPMMPDFNTGCVRLRIACTDGRINAVHVSCERPDVTMALRGRTTAQAVQRVLLLFALCGRAQTRAAVLASAAARGEECLPLLDPDIQREVLREHLWHCLLDLPTLLGDAALQRESVSAAKWVAEENRSELHALLTSSRIATLRQRLQQSDDTPFLSRLLPRLDAKSSLCRMAAINCRILPPSPLARHDSRNRRHRTTNGQICGHPSFCTLAGTFR